MAKPYGQELILYLEAAGVLSAMNAGVTLESVRRPMLGTTIKRKADG